jgi:hypothetical protein
MLSNLPVPLSGTEYALNTSTSIREIKVMLIWFNRSILIVWMKWTDVNFLFTNIVHVVYCFFYFTNLYLTVSDIHKCYKIPSFSVVLLSTKWYQIVYQACLLLIELRLYRMFLHKNHRKHEKRFLFDALYNMYRVFNLFWNNFHRVIFP